MSTDRRSALRYLTRAAAAGITGSWAAACGRGRVTARPTAVPSTTAPGPTAAGPTRSGRSPVPPFDIVHGPRDRPLVALTFHGQGDPAIAEAVLAEAARAGARLTVMAVGTWLDEQPRMARRILDGGHELGNHTLHHRDISAMDAHDAYAEITGCADRLRRLTGSPGRYFRPSQARHATALVARLARRAGYAHCLSYDVDSLDWTDPGPAAVRRTVLGAVRGGSVVSLHLGHPGTVAALPAILDGLHRRGLRAVTTSELVT